MTDQIARRPVHLLLVVVVISLLAGMTMSRDLIGPQNSGDDVALRKLIERYFAAYAGKDIEALSRSWSDKSPDLAPAKITLKELFALDVFETQNLLIRNLKVEGDHASGLVTLEATAVRAPASQSAAGKVKLNRMLSFVKEGNEWKVWRDVLAEEELAARLSAVKTDDERTTMLNAQPDLMNSSLRRALIDQGIALRNTGQRPQALRLFEYAQHVAEQINDQSGVALSWIEIAFVHLIQGELALALDQYQKAQTLCEPLGDQNCLAGALVGLGNTYRLKGNPDLGIEYLKKGLAVSEQAKDQLRTAAALNSLGAAYDSQDQYVEAINYYQKGLRIYESLGQKARVAILLSNAGASYNSLGEFDRAIEFLRQSLVISGELGDRNSMAGAYNNIGTAYSLKGDYSSAMSFFQKGLAIFEAQNDKRSAARNYVNIANVHLAQGNLNLALEYLQKSLAIYEALHAKADTAGALNNVGLVYMELGNYQAALETYQKSLASALELKDRARTARVMTNLGTLYRLQANYALALENFQSALRLREELGEKSGIAKLLGSMATLFQLQHNYSQAAENAERAISISRETGSRVDLADFLAKAGSAYQSLGQSDQAQAAFQEAISITESLRADAGGEQEQQQFFEKRVSPYYAMVQLLAAQNDASAALSYAESAKSRVLLDILRGGKVNITRSMTAAEQAREQEIRAALVTLNGQLARENRRAQPDQKRLATLQKDLEKTRLERQDFQSRLYAAHPELRVQRAEESPFKPEDIRALGVEANTAVLEFAVTEEQTYLFVLSRGRHSSAADVKVYTIPLKRAELAAQVAAFREKIAAHNLLIREPARQLYDLLLKPAGALLQTKTNLIIVPDDVLWELPFHALLSDSNHYLIEQSAVSYAPSLTVLREMIAKQKERHANGSRGNTLLALGNPALGQETLDRVRTNRRDEKFDPLPEAEREVQTLARLYGPSQSTVFIGPEAREDHAKTEAGKFRVLHFATHGVVNNASPMYSYLALSQGDSKEDGLLEAWELLNLELKADLVVLSACETARGRVGAGEGMIGLSWALFVAGAPTAVVSQWKVDSASTTELMLEFHRNLLAPNSKAQSLRKAMLKMLASKQYKHPFYWAPFVVIGDAN